MSLSQSEVQREYNNSNNDNDATKREEKEEQTVPMEQTVEAYRQQQQHENGQQEENEFQAWLQQTLPIDKVIQLEYWPPKNTTIQQYYDWSLPTHEIYKVTDLDNTKSYCFNLEECRAMYNNNNNNHNHQHHPNESSLSSYCNTNNNHDSNTDHATATKENILNDLNNMFTPTFCVARSRLDYSYHTHVVKNRQYLQDAILKRIVAGMNDSTTANNNNESNLNVSSSELPENNDEGSKGSNRVQPRSFSIMNSNIVQLLHQKTPWIVFTAGPMGVGKGYVITQLQQQQYLNVSKCNNFITIDPDLIKYELPEMVGYIQIDRTTAATKLHRESTQMADIIFEYAIDHSMSILVDGSLRDVNYHLSLFNRIRTDYKQYRIAIIHITASKEDIYERAKSRAQRTGRVIPKQLLDESIEQVPRSVQLLSPHADAVHVIANPPHQPIQLLSSTYYTKKRRRRRGRQQSNGTPTDTDHNNIDDEWITTVRTSNSWDDFAHSWDSIPVSHQLLDDVDIIEIDNEDDDLIDDMKTNRIQLEHDVSSLTNAKSRYLADDQFEKHQRHVFVHETNSTGTAESASILHHAASMSQMYQNDACHEVANNIWLESYPNYCARCALSSDTQCGICIHNTHICACSECRPSNMTACTSN